MNIILRRNSVGDPFAQNIADNMTDTQVINKDKQPIPVADFVIRWGTTSTLPGDPKVINSASAIHRVYDKGKFRKALADEGLAPKTWVSGTLEHGLTQFLDEQVYPVIVRPLHHVRSLDLNFCENLEQTVRACFKHKDGHYISQYIKKDSEYRVFVAQGKVLAVIKKVPTDPQAVSWGCVDQGAFLYQPWTQWPLAVICVAVRAYLLSKLDFGAVDVIVKDGQAYVLEINTAPEVTPYYGECIGKAFDYMIKNGKETLSVEGNTWQDYIHPALNS